MWLKIVSKELIISPSSRIAIREDSLISLGGNNRLSLLSVAIRMTGL